ncbi:hypothetical protein [Desulfosporosinus sp. FKB]|uniref:hypothetical protein n=1 Tax=Desulfosporosinus sp. FKB TaxID=1969835 RepID=UPI000B49821A|nr:hypothetical protein [Desulfosporosinus sp. FKB]
MKKKIVGPEIMLTEELILCEVECPDGYIPGDGKVHLHDCFKTAWNYVVDISSLGTPINAWLVHGKINVYADIDHAWVELDNEVVFDGVLQRFYKKDCYYRIKKAKKIAIWSAVNATVNFTRFKHYGPWY